MNRRHLSALLSVLAVLLVGCGGSHGNGSSTTTVNHVPILQTQPSVSGGFTVQFNFADASSYSSRIATLIDSSTTAPSTPTSSDYSDPVDIGSGTTSTIDFTLQSAALGHSLEVIVYGERTGSTTYTVIGSSPKSSAVTP